MLLQMKVTFLIFVLFYHVYAQTDLLALSLASTRCYKIRPCRLGTAAECRLELFGEIESGNKNPARELQCYTACIMHQLNLFLDGRISSKGLKAFGTESMETYKTGNIPKRLLGLEKIRNECDSAIHKYADECELAYQFVECLYRKMLPDLLPPIIN